jgi:hypothetical protein
MENHRLLENVLWTAIFHCKVLKHLWRNNTGNPTAREPWYINIKPAVGFVFQWFPCQIPGLEKNPERLL